MVNGHSSFEEGTNPRVAVQFAEDLRRFLDERVSTAGDTVQDVMGPVATRIRLDLFRAKLLNVTSVFVSTALLAVTTLVSLLNQTNFVTITLILVALTISLWPTIIFARPVDRMRARYDNDINFISALSPEHYDAVKEFLDSVRSGNRRVIDSAGNRLPLKGSSSTLWLLASIYQNLDEQRELQLIAQLNFPLRVEFVGGIDPHSYGSAQNPETNLISGNPCSEEDFVPFLRDVPAKDFAERMSELRHIPIPAGLDDDRALALETAKRMADDYDFEHQRAFIDRVFKKCQETRPKIDREKVRRTISNNTSDNDHRSNCRRFLTDQSFREEVRALYCSTGTQPPLAI